MHGTRRTLQAGLGLGSGRVSDRTREGAGALSDLHWVRTRELALAHAAAALVPVRVHVYACARVRVRVRCVCAARLRLHHLYMR